MKEYRAIPKEKEADEFALSKMEEAFTTHTESLIDCGIKIYFT